MWEEGGGGGWKLRDRRQSRNDAGGDAEVRGGVGLCYGGIKT